MKTHYRPLGVPWRWIGLTLCVLAAVTQLTLSPSSRQLTWIFTTLAPSKPTTLVRGGSSGAGASSGSGGGRGYGAGCKGPTVGKPLDYAAAVKRYLSLPWTMRREGAKTVPVKLDANFNLSCFASPYVEGGAFARAGECVVDSIYYPSPPSKPATGAPDWSKRKMEKCAAAKAAIRRQPVSRATHPRDPAVKDERKDYIPAANITCGPSQLCYYPAPQPLDKGGFAEAVNTELGVEVRRQPAAVRLPLPVGWRAPSPAPCRAFPSPCPPAADRRIPAVFPLRGLRGRARAVDFQLRFLGLLLLVGAPL